MSTLMKFPPGVFSLERHETFAIERFSYNLARAAGQILFLFEPRVALEITFSEEPHFDVWVSMLQSDDDNEVRYKINASAISPQIILGLCHFISSTISPYQSTKVDEFQESVARFISVFAGIDADKNSSLNDRLRSSGKQLGGLLSLVPDTVNAFDLVVQFIVNHEIAHAATGQFLNGAFGWEHEDKALEIVADLAATDWLFTRMIRLTPDSDEYRKMRGTSTHSESILQNAYSVLHSQILVVILFAVLPSLMGNARPGLSGGPSHPHGLARHMLHHIGFMTLLESNCQPHLSKDAILRLDQYWKYTSTVLLNSGILSVSDMRGFLWELISESYLDRAADYIEQNNIKFLVKAAPFLRYFGRNHVEILERLTDGSARKGSRKRRSLHSANPWEKSCECIFNLNASKG
jgi:hypothetical protein